MNDSNAPLNLNKDDMVWLRLGDRTIEATVLLISPNKVSMMLAFDAMLDRYLGMMPVLWTGDGYIDIMTGGAIELRQQNKKEEQ